MLGRRALIGVIVVILGVAAIPAVSYSAGAGHGQSTAKEKCQAGEVGKSGECRKRKPAAAAPSGTISVDVFEFGGSPTAAGCSETKCPVPHAPVYVGKLGSNGDVVSSFDTTTHTIAVPAGKYVVVL